MQIGWRAGTDIAEGKTGDRNDRSENDPIEALLDALPDTPAADRAAELERICTSHPAAHLDFAAANVDMVGLSFVRTPEDLHFLPSELDRRGAADAYAKARTTSCAERRRLGFGLE
ncbi:MAG: hypothetical protein JNM25_05870 [Planctomycetes bacterium]|nr:hypothetical protein [Planctomycetota bacterium]